jgi:hypothetical protein
VSWNLNDLMSYRAFILLPRQAGVSLDAVYEKLANSGSFNPGEVALRHKSDHLELVVERWCLQIGLVSGLSVLEESREIAEQYAKSREDQPQIFSSDSRFELESNGDPGMENFNNFVLTVEYLNGEFGGIPFALVPGIHVSFRYDASSDLKLLSRSRGD